MHTPSSDQYNIASLCIVHWIFLLFFLESNYFHVDCCCFFGHIEMTKTCHRYITRFYSLFYMHRLGTLHNLFLISIKISIISAEKHFSLFIFTIRCSHSCSLKSIFFFWNKFIFRFWSWESEKEHTNKRLKKMQVWHSITFWTWTKCELLHSIMSIKCPCSQTHTNKSVQCAAATILPL